MSREVQASYSIRAWSYEVQSRSDSVSPDVFLHQPVAIARGTQRFFGWPFLLVTWLAFSLGKLDFLTRTEKSQEMKAMRLTRNEHHRKLRAPIRDVSDWLVNADVSDFCHPPALSLAM
jgi:hypothetical protein